MKFSLTILSVILSFFALVSCSSDDKKSDTAEGAFNYAAEFDKEERWEEAIRRYQEVKNKFPYSRFATMAELAIADCYYKQESFPEAQVAYQSFKDLHPKHPQIDYVTFKLAMSYFSQLPTTVDRDLTLASSAILSFEEVVRQYPNSPYVKESTENRDKAVRMLAEKEDYIAEFYFKREKYDSAIGRYEGIFKKYPGMSLEPKAIAYAAVCAIKLGEQGKAKRYIADLEKRFPGSKELAFAKSGGNL